MRALVGVTLAIRATFLAKTKVAKVLGRVRVSIQQSLDEVLLALGERSPHVGNLLEH